MRSVISIFLYLLFILISSVTASQNRDIPILRITTIDSVDVPNTKEYVSGLSSLEDGGIRTSLGSTKIRTRGNSTSSFPKKPYQIKFDERIQILGMPADERWVLLANYSDKTMLRTEIALQLGRMSNLAFTPESKFVNLEINDVYQGLYQLVQKVEQTANRVNLSANGYLLEVEMQKRIKTDDICFTTQYETVCIKYPELRKKDARYDQIEAFVNEAEDVLFSKNFTDKEAGWRKYIEEDALVDWYLINEITKNNDAKFHTSVFMTYELGGKLVMGPLWDYDISQGNINYNGNEKPQGLWIKKAPWISRLYKDPAFLKSIKKRYAHFYKQKTTFIQMLVSESERLSVSQQHNDEKWQVIGKRVWPNHKNFSTYKEEVNYLKKWLETRLDWLYKRFDNL